MTHRTRTRRAIATSGFTIVEVLIAVTLLASISVMVGAATSTMFSTRDYLETRYERFQIVRNALGRMTKEIASSYLAGPAHGGEEIPGQERDPTDIPDAELRRRTIREPIQFAFIGREDSVNFTSFSHVRTQPNESSGNHAEIGYFLRKGEDDVTGEQVTQLVRREDTSYDDDVTRGGTIYVMIPSVEEVEFAYWDAGPVRIGTLEEAAEGRWVSEWDTTRREHAGRLPTRVRITVTIPPQKEGRDPETFVTQAHLGITELLEF